MQTAWLIRGISAALAAVTFCAYASRPSQATSEEIKCEEHPLLADELHMPLYRWQTKKLPRGIVIALHGLVMHGKTYDLLAQDLAKEGFVVYATDLRGHGRLTRDYPHEFCSPKDCKQKLNYEQSAKDVQGLIKALHDRHPSLPIFCIGESLGADIAIRIASSEPELLSGIILSAPAIQNQWFLIPRTIMNMSMVCMYPNKQLDMTPYMKRYASEDPRIVAEMISDKRVRSHLSIWDLIHSTRTLRGTLAYADSISANTPVLVLQGTNDQILIPGGAEVLLRRLPSHDRTVRWYEKGHILLETAFINTAAKSTVLSWIKEKSQQTSPLQAFNRQPLFAKTEFARTELAGTNPALQMEMD